MSELISGKEAWVAIYEGDQVEFLEDDNWDSLYKYFHNFVMDDFKSEKYKFRLKPRTITLNGIEVPAPFNGKLAHKQYAYFLSTAHPKGYSEIKFYDGNVQPSISWVDEEEIKQVVAALREVFK